MPLTGLDEFGDEGPMPPAEVDQVRAMLPRIIVGSSPADYWTTQNCWASVPLQRQVCS